jgi:putative DNA-invertase from lambdoid prophage Rac
MVVSDIAIWEGKILGRPSKTTDIQRVEIIKKLQVGESVSAVAREYKVSRASIIGIRDNFSNLGYCS